MGRPAREPTQQSDLTIVELSAAYRRFAKGYYRTDGRPTDTLFRIWRSTELLCEKYGRTQASDFGPRALKAFQLDLIQRDLCRCTINQLVACIRRMVRWAVAEELVAPVVFQALAALPGLRKGRTKARESVPVGPVPDSVLEATFPHLPTVVADMLHFQRLTGCRPGEVCLLRPCDVDTSQEVWCFRPASHKTQYMGRERMIFIGPKAQKVLRPYLLRHKNHYCFVPSESERRRNARRRENRKSPMTPSQAKRRPKPRRRRAPGNRYTVDSYRRATTRAIEKANCERAKHGEPLLPHWKPNQLRHSAATAIRRQFSSRASRC